MSDTRLIEQAGYGKLWITTTSIVCYLGDTWILEQREVVPLQKIILKHVFTHDGEEEDSLLEVEKVIRRED
jgi:hypothetical protein